MIATARRAQAQTALERYGRPDMPESGQRDSYKAGLVDYWMRADVDYLITVSFSQEVYERYSLNRPDRMMAFVRQRMESAGYFGPHVLVVHDKHGTAYWHPHLIIKDNGAAKHVEREFRRFGDLGKDYNGPIRSSGAFAYHAERAVELWPDVDNCHFEPHWTRRSRPRGRGGAKKATI